MAMHSTISGVAGTGVGCERITVPATPNSDTSVRHVRSVGMP